MFETLKEYIKTRSMTDLELNYQGQLVWQRLVQKEITPADIYNIQIAHGYDVACWVLFKAYQENPQFKELLQFVDEQKNFYSKGHREYTVVCLAHNPWLSETENSDYQWRMKNIAGDMGFECSFPEIPYRRSIFPNAYYYQDVLKRMSGRKVILMTHGLAALEVRWLLEKSTQLNVKIMGWLNISGMLFGTSLPPSDKDWFYNLKKYFNQEHPVLPEVARSNSYCYGPLKTDVPMVSVLGIRPSRYHYLFEKSRDRELNFWGPHDGFVTLPDYLQRGGVVWPLWGQGHQIDLEMYRRRIQGALKWFLKDHHTDTKTP